MRRLARATATAAIATTTSLAALQCASAISADLARKCRELAIKAHPTVLAGTAKGTAQAQRDYFQACVAKGGKAEDDATKK